MSVKDEAIVYTVLWLAFLGVVGLIAIIAMFISQAIVALGSCG